MLLPERYVLGVVAVEHPDLSVAGGPGHAVAVVVEEDPLIPGGPPQPRGQPSHLLHRGVQALPVPTRNDIQV